MRNLFSLPFSCKKTRNQKHGPQAKEEERHIKTFCLSFQFRGFGRVIVRRIGKRFGPVFEA